jgi:hypothetical protein
MKFLHPADAVVLAFAVAVMGFLFTQPSADASLLWRIQYDDIWLTDPVPRDPCDGMVD